MSQIKSERYDEEDARLLLNTQKTINKKKRSYFIKKFEILLITIILGAVVFYFFIKYITGTNGSEMICNKIPENFKNSSALPFGFEWLYPDDKTGPITTNKSKDDHSKLNYYDFLHEEDNSFYYNYDKFNELKEIEKENSEDYYCELSTTNPPEQYKGFNITCPEHYTISIDYSFYGRYANDNKHCIIEYFSNTPIDMANLNVTKNCGKEKNERVKELCEGRVSCTLLPHNDFLIDECSDIYKYLHVKYHCVKDKELKKERISIVMFSNQVSSNSVTENSISAFYQYSQIHDYDFHFEHYRYDFERQMNYMKLNSILEQLMIGLKEKKYDWIFWVDNDVVLCNPNIRLEAFLPDENMSHIHLILADINHVLNPGVFFIRVHPWSLNFIMRAMSYSYYNKDKKIENEDFIKDVLINSEKSDHCVVVPQKWFNDYSNRNKTGDFLLHTSKDNEAKEIRNQIRNNDNWYKKKSKEMRDEVLQYYQSLKDKST